MKETIGQVLYFICILYESSRNLLFSCHFALYLRLRLFVTSIGVLLEVALFTTSKLLLALCLRPIEASWNWGEHQPWRPWNIAIKWKRCFQGMWLCVILNFRGGWREISLVFICGALHGFAVVVTDHKLKLAFMFLHQKFLQFLEASFSMTN